MDRITRTQNAVFKLAVSESIALVPGQIVRLRLDEQIKSKGYLLPTAALVPGPRGLWNVFVVGNSDKVEQRNVELLCSLGEDSLVTGTIEDGDRVVVSGVHRIVIGQAVGPIESKSEVPR